MKTSGKAHGNLWDATLPGPYAQLTNLRSVQGGKGEGGKGAGSQRIHQAALFAFDGLQLGIVRIPPFALIVNNGPPWKIIVEGTVAQLGGLSNEIASPHLGTHLAAFFNQHKIYQIKFECSGVVQIKCKAAETSTKITCQSHCNQSEFASPPPSTPVRAGAPPQPTPYWWWLYVMFVPRKICMWKAFPLAAWAPAKLAIKWLEKKCKTKKECKTFEMELKSIKMKSNRKRIAALFAFHRRRILEYR